MPFYFAWCGPDQPFDGSVVREDEAVFAFDLVHQEGQLPTLSVDIKNPHIGLLAPGRAQWAWLSYSDGTGLYPLFYGRLVALPTNLLAETVTLQFVARPTDYLAQKQAIVDGLMVEPYYDPIWISTDKLTDPDTILETYAMTWHVDRVTLGVSISDIIFGEDGTEEFQPEESFYDSVSISFAQSPQTRVVFDGTVQWTQAATDVIAMPDVSLTAWNGQQIINDWPKPGTNLHGGWSVEFSAMTNWSDQLGGGTTQVDLGGDTGTNLGGAPEPINPTTDHADVTQPKAPGEPAALAAQAKLPTTSPGVQNINISWQNQEATHQDGDTMSVQESVNYDAQGKLGGKIISQSGTIVISDPSTGTPASSSLQVSYQRIVGEAQVAPPTAPPTPVVTNPDGSTSGGGPITIPSLFGQLALRYDLSLPRTETFTFVMDSDVQPIVLLPPDEAVNVITLSMHGQDLGLPIDPDGDLPIGDPSRSAFLPTDRGQLAMQYPMLVARAHLAQAARAAKIQFDCTFERALNLSCRKNALLHDPRLPSGRVIGKITEYHLKVDGDKGSMTGTVQIETTIGNGTSITLNEGTPTYVEENYVAVGYQFYSGAEVALPSDDASIVMPSVYLPDDEMVLPLTFDSAVLVFEVHDGTPVDVVVSGAAVTADPTWLEIALMPVTGQKFSTNYDLGHSTLVLPKLIDLAAPSA